MKKRSFFHLLTVLSFIISITLVSANSQAAVIFQDGFESGNLTAGGWTTSGYSSISTQAYNGSYAARMDDNGYLVKVVSTEGYENITLSYARYTYGYDWGEQLTVAWSTDGSNWNTVETYNGGWGINQTQLGTGADNQSTLYILFSSNAYGWYERFRIDDVTISGTNGSGDDDGDDGSGDDGSGDDGNGQTNCLPEVQNFTAKGPYSVRRGDIGRVDIYVPQNLPEGCKVPVIHLANGTGASCYMYGDILEHYASHGFLAACYEDSNTGQGTQAITAIETVIQGYSDIADTKYGFTGHSQGGGGAIMGVYRAETKWGASRTYTGFAIEPAHGYGDSPYNWENYYAQISSPISMFNGSSDGLVSATWVRSGYNALPNNLEKAWYEAVGASHMTPMPLSYASEMGLAWFRWQLLGDSNACAYFKNMPSSYNWRLQDVDNLSTCE